MSKRLWRDSQGKIWLVSETEMVSADDGTPFLDEPPLTELRIELPMRFHFKVSMSDRRPLELIPDEELEALVQEKFYTPRST